MKWFGILLIILPTIFLLGLASVATWHFIVVGAEFENQHIMYFGTDDLTVTIIVCLILIFIGFKVKSANVSENKK